jgi:8-oxo-dGTP pyrophosphatase MutT (NUDIX family)
MLRHLVFAGLSRTLLQPWHRLRRGLTLGVRGLVRDAGGQVLLIRHTYAPGWQFPGGGVERGETMEEALARELKEEAAVELLEAPVLFGIYSNHSHFPGDHIGLYLISSYRRSSWRPSAEIADLGFFDPTDLPADTTEGTRQRISEVLNRAGRATFW